MHLLYVKDRPSLIEETRLFDEHVEPLIKALESFSRAGKVPKILPEIQEYIEVCRWPFRRVEYSFLLDALLDRLKPGDRFLDAGAGVTPLAYVMAGRGLHAEACDRNERVIQELKRLDMSQVYGASVDYSVQDLCALSFPAASFDAVSCVSVLEHIPAPEDQKAIQELVRVIKPGGLLVLTVDYEPAFEGMQPESRSVQRAKVLLRQGAFVELARGLARKIQAKNAVKDSRSRHPRSAHQCFSADHLMEDILPALPAEELPCRLSFPKHLRPMQDEEVSGFWDLEPGLFDRQGRRRVLPAAMALRTAAGGQV